MAAAGEATDDVERESVLKGQGARAGPRCRWGGANQYRSIEQVAARNVHRIVLSGPWTTSLWGQNRSRSLLTNQPECKAITVTGVGLGEGDGVFSRGQVPAGFEALSALMKVHSMRRPRGGRPKPVVWHGPGVEL